jgi:hypothetical protein
MTTSYSSEYTIDCPLLCGGESELIIRGWGKPVTVKPCADCVAKGGRAWTCTFTQADGYMRPVVSTTWQHKDGLVSFR